MSLVAALESVMRAVLGEPVPMRERVFDRCPAGLDRNRGVAVLVHRSSTPAARLEVIVEAVQIGAITRETAAQMIAEMEPGAGLVPCPACGTDQAPRDGRMAVHFATREATRPCAASWPVKAVPR